MKIFEIPKGFNGIAYHTGGIDCEGCKKKFCHTVKIIEDGEKFCKICYNHRFGTDEMNIVSKKLDELANYLWETPISEIKPEIKEKLNWIGKNQANL